MNKTCAMKYSFIFLFLFSQLYELKAQRLPVKKIYGYKQQLFKGKKPADKESLKKTEQYRLFIECKNNSSIKITGVWIQSGYFKFTTHNKQKSPILDLQQSGSKKILVPKTANSIIEIEVIIKQESSPRPNALLGKLLQSNDVVISYVFKGKSYFATLNKLIELDPFTGM